MEHSRRPNGRIGVGRSGARQRPVYGVVTAATCGRDVVVVLPLVGGDHGPEVMGCALDVLSYGAPGVCALIVAPAIIFQKNHTIRQPLKHLN